MRPSNRRRVVRALEVTLGSGRRFSSFGPGLATYAASRFQLIGLRLPPAEVARRIKERFLAQLGAGFLDEVRGLASSGPGLSRTARQALGYRELLPTWNRARRWMRRLPTASAGRGRSPAGSGPGSARDPRITWIDPFDPGGRANPLAALPTLLGHWIRCPSSA